VIRFTLLENFLAGNISHPQARRGVGDLDDGALPAERGADGVRQAAVIPLRMVAPCIDAARARRR
jgi:hypothetical protein